MNTKKLLLAAALLAVAIVGVSFVLIPSAPAPTLTPATGPRAAPPPAQRKAANARQTGRPQSSANPAPGNDPAPFSPTTGTTELRLARQAVDLVGIAPEANQYFIAAINDLNLPARERRDLIEDLADEGLPDRPTAADLPLIVSRLQLIDELAPSAIDQANVKGFEEAREDLMDDYNRLTRAAGGNGPR